MIEEKIEKLLNKALFEEFNVDYQTKVRISSQDFCDYQCDDCFSLAKILRLAPILIGNRLLNKLNENKQTKNYFEKIEVVNGFINFVLSDEFIKTELENINSSEKYGVQETNKKELYFLDYGGPNLAKPLHVGHLRSPIIGESIKRIIEFKGHNTLSDVHYGDYGLQIGEVIFGLKERGILPENATLSDLNEIYPEISARIKVDEELNKTCAQITKDLQEGNKEYYRYFEYIRDISKDDIKKTYKYLDVNFDFHKGESDAYPFIDKLTEILNEKGLLQDSQGAKVIDISKETDTKQLPPLIYQKSNGAYLYGTTDMAAVLDRVENHNPDHIIYVVDARQSLHFEQFFRALHKSGIIERNKLEYLGFGTVNGIDGKPYKTREGKSPKLVDLFEEIKTILQKTKQMDLENENDIDKIVNSVIKFADLQNNYEKDYIFDIEKFSKTEGKTGPYILYSFVRTNKVVKNYSQTIKSSLKTENKNKIERDLKLKLLSFASTFNRAFIEKRPSIIADFIYDLCTKMNMFYETNRFTNKDNQDYLSSWLFTLNLSVKMLKSSLKMLAIDVPNKM